MHWWLFNFIFITRIYMVWSLAKPPLSRIYIYIYIYIYTHNKPLPFGHLVNTSVNSRMVTQWRLRSLTTWSHSEIFGQLPRSQTVSKLVTRPLVTSYVAVNTSVTCPLVTQWTLWSPPPPGAHNETSSSPDTSHFGAHCYLACSEHFGHLPLGL